VRGSPDPAQGWTVGLLEWYQRLGAKKTFGRPGYMVRRPATTKILGIRKKSLRTAAASAKLQSASSLFRPRRDTPVFRRGFFGKVLACLPPFGYITGGIE
jgi:hypothetical protein